MKKSRKNRNKSIEQESSSKEKIEDNKHDSNKKNKEYSFSALDFKLLWVWAKKYRVVFFILIPLIITIFLRIQPAHLPLADDWAKSNTYSMIKSNIENSISANYPNIGADKKKELVNKAFNEVIKKGTITYGGNTVNINEIIKENAKYLRSRFQRDSDKQTYLLAIDPYFFYRRARNLANQGYEGNMEIDGEYYDTKILGGMPLKYKKIKGRVTNLHIWFEANMYKLLHMINNNITLMQTAFYVPVIISALTVLAAFLLGKKLSGNVGGLFASVMIALHPVLLNRTIGGFSDTDAYNIFFPILIAWLAVEAITAKNNKKTIWYSIVASVSVALFSFTWSGWWYIYDFILIAIIGYVGYEAIVRILLLNKSKKRNEVITELAKDKDILTAGIFSVVFLVLSGILVTMITGFNNFMNFIRQVFSFTKIKAVAVTKVWPNVYTTVAEMNPSKLPSTLSQISMGSKLLLALSLMGIAFALINVKKRSKSDNYFMLISAAWYILLAFIGSGMSSTIIYGILISIPIISYISYKLYKIAIEEKIKANELIDAESNKNIIKAIVLVAWFAGTIYASSKGVRFVILLVPAFSIAFGVAIEYIYRMLSSFLSKMYDINKDIVSVVIALMMIIVLVVPVNVIGMSYNTAKREVPSMNDAWYGLLTKIKNESSEDAIINSWWDFGHWFEAIGDRAATLDGGRQNNPQAHWLGKLMLTENEVESKGILRMLDCGATMAYDTIYKYNNKDTISSINILYKIIDMQNKTSAEEYLLNRFDKKETEEILNYTYCSAPEDYFITSADMVGKSGVWAHFGAWNFTKAVMYHGVYNTGESEGIRILMDDFNLSADDAKRIFNEIKTTNADQWISPWPSYVSGLSRCVVDKKNESLLKCGNGIIFDMDKEEAYLYSGSNMIRPARVSFIDKAGKFKVKKYSKNVLVSRNRKIGAAIISKDNAYYSILMDDALTASIFTRLFYFNGQGLKYFKLYDHRRDITGSDIYTWKIEWDGIVSENKSINATNSTSIES